MGEAFLGLLCAGCTSTEFDDDQLQLNQTSRKSLCSVSGGDPGCIHSPWLVSGTEGVTWSEVRLSWLLVMVTSNISGASVRPTVRPGAEPGAR